MNTARQWLAAQLARSHTPTLDIALLTNRGARYATSRVSLVGVRALMRTGLHIAELYLLSGEFPFQFLIPLLAMRSVPGLVSGIHWGALEGLRAYVRREVAHHRPERANACTEGWLVLAGFVGGALLVATLAFTSVQTSLETETLGLYGSFAMVCALAIAVDAWTRTYHAGVFATGRVYRPSWSIFVPDLLDLGVLFVLWPRLGPFAIHCVVLTGVAVRGSLATYYAAGAYRARRRKHPHPFRIGSLTRLTRHDMLHAGKHAFATLPLHLDRALLLVLLGAPSAAGGMPISAPYYALRPILGFANAWPRAFYADLVRLDVAALGMLRRRFEHLLQRTAFVAGMLSAGLVACLAFLSMGMQGLTAAAWLMPLAVVRSLFALKQLRAFVYGAHIQLILVSAVLLIGLIAAPLAGWTDQSAVMGITLLLLVASTIAGRVANRAAQRRNEYKRRLPVAAWLAEVCSYASPLRLTIARVDKGIASPGAVIAEIGRFTQHGHVARCGSAWLMWWEPEEMAKTRAELAHVFAGTVAQMESVSAANGMAALRRALATSVLPPKLAAALHGKRSDARTDLRLLAESAVPRALVIDLRSSGPMIQHLTPRQLALARRAALASAREQYTVPRWAPWQAATYAPCGEIEVIYLWSKGAIGGRKLSECAQRASWRDSVSLA